MRAIFHVIYALYLGNEHASNGEVGAFNKIAVSAQNVLVLTDKTDINKPPRQDGTHPRVSSKFTGRIVELLTTMRN